MSYRTIPNLLGAELAAELLQFAIVSRDQFQSTAIGTAGAVKRQVRQSRRLSDLGDWQGRLEPAVLAHVPRLINELQITPYPVSGLELELVAHEDGAFYQRHIDLFTGTQPREQLGQDRFLSLVCYLNREPKRFQGGELRLFTQLLPSQIANDPGVDIVPQHGLGVAFSSWLPHEVRPVICQSADFADARFALNCWVLRACDSHVAKTAPADLGSAS